MGPAYITSAPAINQGHAGGPMCSVILSIIAAIVEVTVAVSNSMSGRLARSRAWVNALGFLGKGHELVKLTVIQVAEVHP